MNPLTGQMISNAMEMLKMAEQIQIQASEHWEKRAIASANFHMSQAQMHVNTALVFAMVANAVASEDTNVKIPDLWVPGAPAK